MNEFNAGESFKKEAAKERASGDEHGEAIAGVYENTGSTLEARAAILAHANETVNNLLGMAGMDEKNIALLAEIADKHLTMLAMEYTEKAKMPAAKNPGFAME